MKYKILLCLLCVLTFSSACSDPEPDFVNLALSTDALSIGPEGGKLTVEITCNASWQISGAPAWCTPDPTTGKGNASLTLTIAAAEQQSRQATLTISSSAERKTITVNQNASLEAHHYELPVIFHVLRGPADNEQIRPGWLAEIINACNANYMGLLGDSPDMNMEFVLADKKPDGTRLAQPGLEYVSWSSSTIDMEAFMDTEHPDPKAVALQWDLNQYINIYVYDFGDGEDVNTTGVAFLPYSVSENRLAGLVAGNIYLTRQPAYVHCVSLNRRYLYNRSTANTYNSADIVITLSHELGHYLGLHHTFSTSRCGENDDYCADTPDYDRSAYETWLDQFIKSAGNEVKLPQLTPRTGCDGKPFTSHNIMDYDYSYNDRFSEDQSKRIRYVLGYSPLIPGPKYDRAASKNSQDMEIPPATLMR